MRLFFAVDPGPEAHAEFARLIRAGLALRHSSRDRPRFSHADDVHLTLVFLGEVDPERLPRLEASALSVAARHAPFALRLGAAGVFGAPSRPRVAWVGVDGESDALAKLRALQADLDAELRGVGLPLEERPYAPHWTVARARSGAQAKALQAFWDDVVVAKAPFSVDELVLYRSDPGSAAARYTPVHRARLGRRDP